MNETMFLATMIDVLKYDSKFKDKRDTLLPILRRCYVNSLPQYEFVRYGRSGQRYENVEIRVPVPMLDAANALRDDIYDLVNYVYEEILMPMTCSVRLRVTRMTWLTIHLKPKTTPSQ